MPYGVTNQMIEAWGPVIFDLSLNKQNRKGDPVRKLDHAAWVAQRDATGLCDDEIADRIGLARPQVTFIRNVLERRVFRTNQYRKLYRLGGGLRWRPDDYVDPEEAYAIRPEAALLRQALAFDRDRVAAWIGGGQWTAQTAWHRLAQHAHEGAAHDRAGGAALAAGNERLTWAALRDRAEAMANGLAARGVGRGEAVALALPPGADALVAMAAVWRLGGVVLPLPANLDEAGAGDLLHKGRVRAVLFDPSATAIGADGLRRLSQMLPALSLLAAPDGGPEDIVPLRDLAGGGANARLMPPVGGDPALLLVSGSRLAPHTHQTLLAGARALSASVGESPAGIAWSGPMDGARFAVALGHWLVSGAPLVVGESASGDLLRLESGSAEGAGAAVISAWAGGRETRVLAAPECPVLLIGDGDSDVWATPPGAEIRVGETGEIEARGPGAAPAYVDDPAGTAAGFRPGGWLRTGVAGRLDGDGKVTLANSGAV